VDFFVAEKYLDGSFSVPRESGLEICLRVSSSVGLAILDRVGKTGGPAGFSINRKSVYKPLRS
jgi:hypothetical protein